MLVQFWSKCSNVLHRIETQQCRFNVEQFHLPFDIKSTFTKTNLSARGGEFVSLIKSLLTEFNLHLQDFSASGKTIKVFSSHFLMGAGVDDSLQLEVMEAEYEISSEE